jgi:hypothetical protein
MLPTSDGEQKGGQIEADEKDRHRGGRPRSLAGRVSAVQHGEFPPVRQVSKHVVRATNRKESKMKLVRRIVIAVGSLAALLMAGGAHFKVT